MILSEFVSAQVVMGELEYMHMQHPSSIDRRAVVQTTSRSDVLPSTENFVARVKNISAVIDTSAIQPPLKNPSHRKNRIARSGVKEVISVGRRVSSEELPHAVSGLAMRMPPTSRRLAHSAAVAVRIKDDYGPIYMDGHQLPEATFI